MVNRAKQKGTAAETLAQRFLAGWWPGITRLAPAGAADCGDLDGVPELCVQVKAQKRMALADWVDQASIQAERAGKPYAVVIHRRWGKGDPGQWYATMPLQDFAESWFERGC
jgi:hypothetical protein